MWMPLLESETPTLYGLAERVQCIERVTFGNLERKMVDIASFTIPDSERH
jgi:hypothetical protein